MPATGLDMSAKILKIGKRNNVNDRIALPPALAQIN